MLGVADQEIRHAVTIANLKVRNIVHEKCRHVADWPQLDGGYAERDNGRRIDVDNGIDIRAYFVNFAMNVPLNVHELALLIDRVGIEVVFHDVLGRDDRRGFGARQKIAIRSTAVAHAYMAVAIEDALVGENAVGGDEIVDCGGIGRAAGLWGRGESWVVHGRSDQCWRRRDAKLASSHAAAKSGACRL